MRIVPIPRRARLWLLWLLVVFGVLNAFGPPIEAWRRAGDRADVGWQTLRARQTPVERLMTMLRDDGDVERYFAYAEAALGRPYAADFVRPAGKAGLEGPPDPTRIATPSRPLAPWRDFAVEYPPGMMAAALLPAVFTHDQETYVRLFALEMEAALTLAVFLAARTADRLRPGAGEAALAQATLLTLALGVVAVRRYDPTVALAIAAAVHALVTRRPAMSGAALGLGVALKGVPILLAPIFALSLLPALREKVRTGGASARQGRSPGPLTPALAPRGPTTDVRPSTASAGSGSFANAALARFLAGLAATIALTGLAYVLIAGPHAPDAFAYHGARPIQVETIYSGLLILARALDPGIMHEAYAYGSLNVIASAEPALRALSSILMVAGILASWAFAWARIRTAQDETGRLVAVLNASLLSLIAALTLGKVFSPQYCVWLIPLAAATAPFVVAKARRLLPFAFLLVQLEYPFLYGLLYSTLLPATGALIALRTAWFWRYAEALASRPAVEGNRDEPYAVVASAASQFPRS